MRRLRPIWLFALLLLGAGLALGQVSGQQRVMTAKEQANWPAIGLLGYDPQASGSICTATLVAADLILTAAHCVSEEGVPFAASDIYFFAGWRDGKSLATARGKSIFMAKGAEQKIWSMESDMALVVLETPIPAQTITPLPLMSAPTIAGKVDFIGYQRDARKFANIASGCRVIDGAMQVLGLSCSVETGNSGSPVLQKGPDGWQMAGLIISYGTGENGIRAYAVRPADEIRQMIAQR